MIRAFAFLLLFIPSTLVAQGYGFVHPRAESEAADPRRHECDPSYPNVCIPSPPPDLDCGEIDFAKFAVEGSDPHGFDADHDGVGCEWGPGY